MKKVLLIACSLVLTTIAFSQAKKKVINKSFSASEVWKDIDGNIINAHGGGILYHDGTYYWYGEIKKGTTTRVAYVTSWEDYRVPAGGVSCYSSKNLLNWKYEGVALRPDTTDPSSEIHTSKVIERPKVVYNEKTKKFVMWMHIDKEDYSFSQAGVAVSDNPEGPFKYLGSVKPNGAMARDMTLFKDDDGQAYLFFSSEENATMHVCLLSDDYLQPTATYKRILIGLSREAPAVFKHQEKYYLISSGCTGWAPNAASYAVADSVLGDWQQKSNPCTGPNAQNTYYAQSTFVLPVRGKKNDFIFMSDRWNKLDLQDSRYLWLPLRVENGEVKIEWKDKWNIE